MTTQAAVSGNPFRNNGATIVKAGNVPSTATRVTKVQNLRDNETKEGKYAGQVSLSTGDAWSSGNLGTAKPLSGGTFQYDPPANVASSTPVTVIARRVSTTISGASNEALKSGASDTGIREHGHFYRGNRLLGISSWNAVTGAATKTAGREGLLIQPSGIDGTVGKDADDTVQNSTYAIPGELVLMQTGKTPSQLDYAAKYNP
jgi:hypothetical protein